MSCYPTCNKWAPIQYEGKRTYQIHIKYNYSPNVYYNTFPVWKLWVLTQYVGHEYTRFRNTSIRCKANLQKTASWHQGTWWFSGITTAICWTDNTKIYYEVLKYYMVYFNVRNWIQCVFKDIRKVTENGHSKFKLAKTFPQFLSLRPPTQKTTKKITHERQHSRIQSPNLHPQRKWEFSYQRAPQN